MNDHPLREIRCDLREGLTDGGPSRLGFFLITGSAMVAEISGLVGADFVVLDMEASPMARSDAFAMIQALSASRTAPLIRVPWLHQHFIEHAMDIGAHGVVVPKVETGEQARAAADAVRYPPEGTRGINPVRATAYFDNVDGYLAQSNQRAVCVLQIESPAGVAAADEIAATPGVDCLFIGMGDLAASYGQPNVMTGEQLDAARQQVLEACRRHGKTAGIFAYSLELARQYASEGFRMIAIGNDVKLLKSAAVAALDEVRSGLE